MESPAPKLMASIAVGKEWDVSKGRRNDLPPKLVSLASRVQP